MYELDSSDTIKWLAFVNTIMDIRVKHNSQESFSEKARATQVMCSMQTVRQIPNCRQCANKFGMFVFYVFSARSTRLFLTYNRLL